MSMNGPKTQVAAVPLVQEGKCLACFRCQARASCKSKALVQMEPGEPPFIDASRCYGCHKCMLACTRKAIVLPRGY